LENIDRVNKRLVEKIRKKREVLFISWPSIILELSLMLGQLLIVFSLSSFTLGSPDMPKM
jgi:hypothetical protein